MKLACESCQQPLQPDAEAYVCSFECTFCPDCTARNSNVCPHCGGELVRRPRRENTRVMEATEEGNQEAAPRTNTAMLWVASFAIWAFVSLAATVTIYQLYRPEHRSGVDFWMIAKMEFSQIFTYAPFTPFVFILATRFPIQRGKMVKRISFHLGVGLVFTVAHIALKSVTPAGYWDPTYREWGSALWDSHTHKFRLPWVAFRSMFLSGVVDDITSAYVPILLVAHAVSYYRRFREGELRASQLEGQLAKARLQTLKSQLHPHFLFNTLHSISALMLTDVQAADRMMSRLSDLLRISLENAGTQITTLERELDFVNCYLEIEKVRFQERLKVFLEMAPETLDAQIPHLLLQPLVDNAVKHGISKLPAKGEIHIGTYVQDGQLHINVRDNGPGLSSQAGTQTTGLGLKVTRERLESLYGEHQSLDVLTSPFGGVVVSVSIPFRISPPEKIEVTATPILENAQS